MVMTSAWWTRRSMSAAATTSSAKTSPLWFPRNRGGLLYAASGSVTAVFS